MLHMYNLKSVSYLLLKNVESFSLEQGLTPHDLQPKSSSLVVFVSKILLDHNHSHSSMSRLTAVLCLNVSIEQLHHRLCGQEKPKIFTLWPFTERKLTNPYPVLEPFIQTCCLCEKPLFVIHCLKFRKLSSVVILDMELVLEITVCSQAVS